MKKSIKHYICSSIIALPLLGLTTGQVVGQENELVENKVHSTHPSEAARKTLLSHLSGEWISKGIYVATKLEIADYLREGPKSVVDLAALTHTNSDSLCRLLHMLAGYEIFEEVSPEVFANTPASTLLIKTNSDTLHSLSLFYGEDMHKSWESLLPSIQTGLPAFQLEFGQPVFSYFKNNPNRAALFQEAMKEKSKAVIKSALISYDFSPFKSIYDIGGGHGQFLQALAHKYPNKSYTLFELPNVINILKQQPTNPNCNLLEGDFFTSIPEGGDVYLLKSVLHDWDDDKALLILKNCYQALKPESRLLIVEIVLNTDNESTYANCMDVLMLAVTGGKERDLSSFKTMLDKAGFTLNKVYSTSTEFSILEAQKK